MAAELERVPRQRGWRNRLTWRWEWRTRSGGDPCTRAEGGRRWARVPRTVNICFFGCFLSSWCGELRSLDRHSQLSQVAREPRRCGREAVRGSERASVFYLGRNRDGKRFAGEGASVTSSLDSPSLMSSTPLVPQDPSVAASASMSLANCDARRLRMTGSGSRDLSLQCSG